MFIYIYIYIYIYKIYIIWYKTVFFCLVIYQNKEFKNFLLNFIYYTSIFLYINKFFTTEIVHINSFNFNQWKVNY